MFPCVAISLRRTAAISTMHPASLSSSDSRGTAFGSGPCSGTATRSTGQIRRLHGVVRKNVQLLGSRPDSGCVESGQVKFLTTLRDSRHKRHSAIMAEILRLSATRFRNASPVAATWRAVRIIRNIGILCILYTFLTCGVCCVSCGYRRGRQMAFPNVKKV